MASLVAVPWDAFVDIIQWLVLLIFGIDLGARRLKK